MHRALRRTASVMATGAILASMAVGAVEAAGEDDIAARGCGEHECRIDNAKAAPTQPDEASAALDLIDGDGPPIGAYATRVQGTTVNLPAPGANEPEPATAAEIADDVIRATTPPPNAEIAGPPDPSDFGAVLASTDFAAVSSGQIADGSVTSGRIERAAPEFRIRNDPLPVAVARLVDDSPTTVRPPPPDAVTIELDGPANELASAMADGDAIPRKPLITPSLTALDLALDDDPMARINGRLVQGVDRGPRDADALNESVQSLLRDTASAPASEADTIHSPDQLDASIERALSSDDPPKAATR